MVSFLGRREKLNDVISGEGVYSYGSVEETREPASRRQLHIVCTARNQAARSKRRGVDIIDNPASKCVKREGVGLLMQ